MPIYTPQTELEGGELMRDYAVEISHDGVCWQELLGCTFADTDQGIAVGDMGWGQSERRLGSVRLRHRRNGRQNPAPKPGACPACGRASEVTTHIEVTARDPEALVSELRDGPVGLRST